ncbi:MAG: ABC transporter substrate-binding protein [Lachnospiraceae bacterium]
MKKETRTFFLLLIGLFLIGLVLCLISVFTEKQTKTKKADLTPVTLNEVAHSIFYAPMYVAIENGEFEKEGLDLKLVTGFGADKTMTALLSGEADIGFMGPETTVYTYNEGASDYAVNFAQLTQRAGNFLVARTEQKTFSWKDLKGKTVLGGRKGGMPEMVFEYVLKKNHIDPDKDLKIDKSIDFGSTAAAFTNGLGDYTVEFEPSATSLEKSKNGYIISSLGVESGYVPYTAFSARKSFLKSHPDEIRAFTKALKRGMDYCDSHSAEEIAKTIKPQFPDADVDTITTIVKRYNDQNTWKKSLKFEKNSYALLLNILTDAGELSKRPDYDALVTTNYLP